MPAIATQGDQPQREQAASRPDVHDCPSAFGECRQFPDDVAEDRFVLPLAIRVGKTDPLMRAERVVRGKTAEIVVAERLKPLVIVVTMCHFRIYSIVT